MNNTPPTPILTFTATIDTMAGCKQCRNVALQMASEALDQSGMQSLTIRATKRHNHPVSELAPPTPSGRLFKPPEPISDTNGSDPLDVDALFLHEKIASADASQTPNGIDPPDK
jgi:hypothetical protein